MKPLFALTLLIGTGSLAPCQHGRIAADTPPAAAQELAAGKEGQPRSALFEALEIRASEDAARQIAGTGEAAYRGPAMAWDRERAFAGMERLRAEIVVLGGLRDAQRELLQWNRERIKTGAAPAVLPARLCREAALDAWCPLLPATFGAAAAGRPPFHRHVLGSRGEHTPPNESGNGPTKDELQ